ncbi:MAG: hypothetical protein Q9187_006373 [Circinaria calcarea]
MDPRSEDVLETVVPFGRAMRNEHFNFDKAYTNLNHGSFGAFPTSVRDYQRKIQDLTESRPDPYLRYTMPELLGNSRAAVASLLGVPVDEVVFVPNATTAVNTVLRNLFYGKGDVILYFSTAYGACEKTVDYVCETTPAESACILLEYPLEDQEIVEKFRDMVNETRQDGRKVKVAMFDTVLTFPGVRMPWEALVQACKELSILSLIDGAHGIGHIELTDLGKVGPDFFASNCYKPEDTLEYASRGNRVTNLSRWLYVPRGCAVFHVPARNQHLIRTSLPTSWGFRSRSDPMATASGQLSTVGSNPFVELFNKVATVDATPYVCVPEALKFRNNICGGERSIREYCKYIAQAGASLMAQILGTEMMSNGAKTLQNCCFANVRLPLTLVSRNFSRDQHAKSAIQPGIMDVQIDSEEYISIDEAPKLAKWITQRTIEDFDTMVPTMVHAGVIWARLSGQIYLELKDFERAGYMLKELCERARRRGSRE